MQPPAHRSQYITESFYRTAYHAKKRKSSRYEPAAPMHLRPGTWKIDDEYAGLYGHEIEELRLLDPNDLVPGEITHEDRYPDVDRYAYWLSVGLTPPPICVVETESGALRIYNGHRRWLAAKQAGVKVAAWVNPIMATGELKPDGRPVMTGLTYELAMGLHAKKGIFGRLWDWVKRLWGGR